MNELLKNPIFATHAVVAAGSVTLATAISYPLDSLKVLVQVWKLMWDQVAVNNSQVLMSSTGLELCQEVQACIVVWGGLTPGRSLGLGARFELFMKYLQLFTKAESEDKYVYVSMRLIGEELLLGAVESTSSSPFELIKLRAQLLVLQRFSSSLAAAASHGFDTAKSRSQCIVLPKFVSLEEVSSNGNCPGRDLRDGPESILQIGISYIVAWDCGWHGVGYLVVVGGYLLAIDRLLSK
ncbi:hypothetical protein HAX54_005222 [Datura stramonium]|uniref:Uncharacterized protein n=1 Tax=Datura stramonium TaxID=4076 RepID=A0ABS8T9J3_DATST|nr:hypothetical protein [Datura stramonium]